MAPMMDDVAKVLLDEGDHTSEGARACRTHRRRLCR